MQDAQLVDQTFNYRLKWVQPSGTETAPPTVPEITAKATADSVPIDVAVVLVEGQETGVDKPLYCFAFSAEEGFITSPLPGAFFDGADGSFPGTFTRNDADFRALFASLFGQTVITITLNKLPVREPDRTATNGIIKVVLDSGETRTVVFACFTMPSLVDHTTHSGNFPFLVLADGLSEPDAPEEQVVRRLSMLAPHIDASAILQTPGDAARVRGPWALIAERMY